MKKCKLTLSGRHKWRKYKDQLLSVSFDDVPGDFLFPLEHWSYLIKCVACKMVDDRKKKLRQREKNK